MDSTVRTEFADPVKGRYVRIEPVTSYTPNSRTKQ